MSFRKVWQKIKSSIEVILRSNQQMKFAENELGTRLSNVQFTWITLQVCVQTSCLVNIFVAGVLLCICREVLFPDILVINHTLLINHISSHSCNKSFYQEKCKQGKGCEWSLLNSTHVTQNPMTLVTHMIQHTCYFLYLLGVSVLFFKWENK